MNRRKIRKYRSARRNSGMKFAGILVIMIAAVICGYLTARFIIAPLLGYDTEVLKLDFPSKLTGLLDRGDENPSADAADSEAGDSGDSADSDDDADDSDADDDDGEAASADKASEADSGYALQFGIFTTEERAQELADDLEADGIDARIREADGKYKVTSPLVDTKDEAVKMLKDTDTDRVKDVFITAIE